VWKSLVIPLLAVIGIIVAARVVVQGSIPPNPSPPVIEPARPPYGSFVAGSGLVEAASENIAVGAPVGAIVTKLHAAVGSDVDAGDPLFQLDTRELDAEMAMRRAALTVAQRQLARLEAGTRPEELPPARARLVAAEAAVSAARVQFADAQAQLERARTLGHGAMSGEEMTRREFAAQNLAAAVEQALAREGEARAQLALLEAGAWGMDIDIARSHVRQAQAAIEAIEIEIDRRTVRSPVKGRVLQRNIREGEFAPAGALATPLMLVGSVSPLHVRVDVDEYEAWRVRPGAEAVAFARGNKDISAPLAFARVEPYIVPKRSLTGASQERVDTRVLQVIYAFDPKGLPLYVGQQVDVYIEAPPAVRGRGQPDAGAAGATERGTQ